MEQSSKTLHEGIVATFPSVDSAVLAGIALQKRLQSNADISHLKIKVAIHKGPAMVATINNRLDYFGSTMKALEYLLQNCEKGEVVASQTIAEEPVFTKVVSEHQLSSRVFEVKIPSAGEHVIKVSCLE